MIGQVEWSEPSFGKLTATLANDGTVTVADGNGRLYPGLGEFFDEQRANMVFSPADGDPDGAFLNRIARERRGKVTLLRKPKSSGRNVVY